MATAAPFVKLLRQLSSAKDEYRSGALDISWPGVKASLYLVFGQPNHATYEEEGEEPLVGQEALAALLHNLPKKFTVAGWRKAVTREETLKMSLEELMEPFAQLAGMAEPEEAAPVDSGARTPAGVPGGEVGSGFSADFDFSLADFPLLPVGESLWSDAAVNVVHLDILIPKLPTAIIVLTGPNLRAAALTLQGRIIDAVWVDEHERAAGEGAAMAIMGAHEGTVSCYKIEDPRLAEALTLLWRTPARHAGLNAQWLNPVAVFDSIRDERRDCVLRIDGAVSGLAFFMGGAYIAGYTSEDRTPSSSPGVIQALLGEPGTVTMYARADDKVTVAAPSEEAYHVGSGAQSYAEGAAAVGAGDEVISEPEITPSAPPAEVAAPGGSDPVEQPAAAEPAASEWAPGEAPAETVQTGEAPAWPAEPAAETQWPAEPAAAATTDWPAVAAGEPSEWDAPAEHTETPAWPAAAAETGGETTWGQHPAEAAAPAWPPASEETPELPSPAEAAAFTGQYGDSGHTAGETPAIPADPDQVAEDEGSHDDGAEIAADFFGMGQGGEQPGWFNQGGEAAPQEAAAPPLLPDPGQQAAAPAPFIFGMNGDQAEAPAAEPDEDDDYNSPRLELDFEGIKQDLIQIGVLWLGSDDVAPVAELIRNTKPSVDDFVSTIDQIKAITVSGHDPSVIRAMAREMHYHAAEYLSGA